MQTPEQKIETLLRVVGNQSVMLYDLRLKLGSLIKMQRMDNDPESAGMQLRDLVNVFEDWIIECDSFVETALADFTIAGYAGDASLYHKCGEWVGSADSIADALHSMHAHKCNSKTD